LQVIDAHTLKVVLREPRPRFIEHLAQPCFSVIKSKPDKTALGTGPFQIAGANNDPSGSVWQLQRNTFYHGGLPLLQEMKLVFHKSNVAEVLMNLGTAGATVKRKKEVEYFRKIDKVRVHSFSTPAIYFLAFNPSAKPLADVSHRRWVASAIDRETVATLINEAECTVATSFFNTLDEDLSPAENGRLPAGRGLVVFFRNQDEVAQQIAERLAVRFARLRIPFATPRPLSNSAFEQVRRSGKYDILIDSYAPIFETPLYNLVPLLQRGYVVDPRIGADLNQALASAFPHEVADLEKALITQAVLYPLVRAQNYAVLPAEMEGAKLLEAQRIGFASAWLPQRKQN
jgi:MarR-like DNA-binding transcriptional regulator SgrR of sgrS sRNA